MSPAGLGAERAGRSPPELTLSRATALGKNWWGAEAHALARGVGSGVWRGPFRMSHLGVTLQAAVLERSPR